MDQILEFESTINRYRWTTYKSKNVEQIPNERNLRESMIFFTRSSVKPKRTQNLRCACKVTSNKEICLNNIMAEPDLLHELIGSFLT